MQYTKSRKKKKKGVVNQSICSKFKTEFFISETEATEAKYLIKIILKSYSNEVFNIFTLMQNFLIHDLIQKVVPDDFISENVSQNRTTVLNFNQFVNRSSTITVTFSSNFNLIPMPIQQLNQAIQEDVFNHLLNNQ
jgi:hypothetical protein